MRRTGMAIAAAALLCLLAGNDALAHRMLLDARAEEDGRLLVQAFFPDGTPARDVEVEVRRPDGSLFQTAHTDDEGRVRLRPDGSAGQWTATAIGSMGHRAETHFVAEGELARAPGRQASPQAEAPPSLAERQPFPWRDALAGLGFIFGLGAFLMCLRLRAELARLRG